MGKADSAAEAGSFRLLFDAKQSGGYIGVYGEVGHGTTFNVYFPPAAAQDIAWVTELTVEAPQAATSQAGTIRWSRMGTPARHHVRDPGHRSWRRSCARSAPASRCSSCPATPTRR